MKKIKLDKALLMARGCDAETAELISVAVNSHEELLAAAKIGLFESEESLSAVGGCDHSVNICSCELVRNIETIQAAIAKAEARS